MLFQQFQTTMLSKSSITELLPLIHLNLSAENMLKMKQYFILSQLNDWNTQRIVEGGTREIVNSDFPLEKSITLAEQKNRVVSLKPETLERAATFTRVNDT